MKPGFQRNHNKNGRTYPKRPKGKTVVVTMRVTEFQKEMMDRGANLAEMDRKTWLLHLLRNGYRNAIKDYLVEQDREAQINFKDNIPNHGEGYAIY